MKFLKWIVYVFAVVGFVLVAGYFAIKFGWTNTSGIIDTQRESFLENATTTKTFTILVVPGHDTNTGGAEFRDIYERDIVVT